MDIILPRKPYYLLASHSGAEVAITALINKAQEQLNDKDSPFNSIYYNWLDIKDAGFGDVCASTEAFLLTCDYKTVEGEEGSFVTDLLQGFGKTAKEATKSLFDNIMEPMRFLAQEPALEGVEVSNPSLHLIVNDVDGEEVSYPLHLTSAVYFPPSTRWGGELHLTS